MAFDSIAYGADEPYLLTIDGAELLAYDASTANPRWRLSFAKPLLSVLFADAGALPGLRGENPFRSQSATRAAIAVDVDGRLHGVDVALGQAIGELGPFGKPGAIASCSVTGALALAVDDKALLWRSGERRDLAIGARATALAFSRDGATLAVGTEGGEVRLFSVADASAPETSRCALRGPIADLAAHPDGWLAASPRGVFAIGQTGPCEIYKIPSGPKRVRFAGDGKVLAVQTTNRNVVVYEWPRLSVLTRIECTDGPVRGLAFGEGDLLGVGLDHGDGSQINVVTCSVQRTGTHPGRKHRSWTLLVESKQKTRSASEPSDAGRAEPLYAPRWSDAYNTVGRFLVAALLASAVLGLRVCARTSSHRTPSFGLPSGFDYKLPTVLGCDRECASRRLDRLEAECEAMNLGCADDVGKVKAAFEDGSCTEAQARLARVSPRADAGAGALFEVEMELARSGLAEACNGLYPPPPPRHATLVRLKIPELSARSERLPEANPSIGETPRAVWAAPDGTVFVVTGTSWPAAPSPSSMVYQRTKSGEWTLVYHRPTPADGAALFGRSSTDVYLSTRRWLAHYDGSSWRDVADADRAGKLPSGVEVKSLAIGGGSSWAVASEETSDVLFERSPAGSWSRRSLGDVDGGRTMHAVWVSPTGQVFVATDESVVRSKNKGAKWIEDEVDPPITAMWGRSGDDVYGATSKGLVHWDGKRWSATSYTQPVTAISGTATEVLVGATEW